MRHLLVGSIAACLAVACLATPAEGQRGAPDNPYPQTIAPSAPLTTKAARAKYHTDSLRAEYPVSARNEACWRYTDPDKVKNGDAYFCYRDRASTLDSALVWGALHTYYRGKWGNVVAVWSNAKTPPVSLVFNDGTQSVPLAFGLDSSGKVVPAIRH